MPTNGLAIPVFILMCLAIPAVPAAQERETRPEDPFFTRQSELRDRLKSASGDAESRAIHEQLRKLSEERRAANPPKEPRPAETDAHQRRMEREIRKDPYHWEMSQLQQAMGSARSEEERESLRKRMADLRAKRAAAQEAELTPQQKAERADRERKMALVRTEAASLRESLSAARTPAERKAILQRIREIHEKHR